MLALPEIQQRYPQAVQEHNAWLASRPSAPTESVKVEGIADVNAYLAAHPQEPGESYFAWQSRIVEGLDPDQKHALLFETRERYAPVDYLAAGATTWRQQHGLPEPKIDISEVPAPREKADAVARAYETTPDESSNPQVQAVFAAFKQQNAEMWDFMTKPESEGGLGVTVDFTDQVDPYPTATAQADDLRDNHHITVQSGLGGAREGFTMTQEEYDRFRAVHDVFGHSAVGGGFDRHGEYQAYLMHSTMYTGDARIGMASEYHGVNTAMWAGEPGSPGTGKSIILPEELIPDPWSPTGDLITAAAFVPQMPSAAQLMRLGITSEEALTLGYLATQIELDATFGARFDPSPFHSLPEPADEQPEEPGLDEQPEEAMVPQ